MGVAGQQQVGVFGSSPTELVGAVGEDDPRGAAVAGLRTVAHVGGRRKPWQFVADQDNRLAANLDLLPTSAQVHQPALPQHAADPGRVGPAVVIAQHEKDAVAGTDPAERVGQPVDVSRAIDQVAGDGHQVRLGLVGMANHFLEISFADPSGKVEVGEVDDRHPVQGRRQPGHIDRAFGHVEFQDLVTRQPHEEMFGPFVGARREGVAVELQRPAAMRADHVGRAMQHVAPEPGQCGEGPRDPTGGQIDHRSRVQAAPEGVSEWLLIGGDEPPTQRHRRQRQARQAGERQEFSDPVRHPLAMDAVGQCDPEKRVTGQRQ